MDFKALKASLESTFQDINNTIQEGQVPQEKVVNTFVRLCTQLHMQAEEAWAGEAEDFAHLASQLLLAVKKGKLEDAVRLTDSLQDAQDYCHRTFKA